MIEWTETGTALLLVCLIGAMGLWGLRDYETRRVDEDEV